MTDFRKTKTLQSRLRAVPPASDYQALWVLYLVFSAGVLAVLAALPVVRGDSSPWGLLGMGLALGAVLLVLGGLLVWHHRRAIRLDQWGEVTQGTIVDRWVEEVPDEADACYVAYQFGDGAPVVQKLDPQVFQTLRKQETVAVRYLPDDPACSRLEL